MLYRIKGYWTDEDMSGVIEAQDIYEAIEKLYGENWTMKDLKLKHYIEAESFEELERQREDYEWREFFED